MPQKRVHVIVKGLVQGVFFRDYTRLEARKLGLCGWVRNRPDGTVEAVLEGNDREVDRMLNWLHQGSPLSRVDEVMATEKTPLNENHDFEVRY